MQLMTTTTALALPIYMCEVHSMPKHLTCVYTTLEIAVCYLSILPRPT